MRPSEWHTKFGYFFTYFGEVYYGTAVDTDFDSDDFYIIGKNQWREYQGLREKNEQKEHLPQLGFHIPSKSMIQHWIDDSQFRPDKNTYPPMQWSGNASDYKKMYVFGAGASANCVFGEGKNQIKKSFLRPPLGPELFADRFDAFIMKYPGLRMIFPKFESRGNDIEAILEDDWNELMRKENKELAAQHTQLQFFLQEIFGLISQSTVETFFRHSLSTLFVQNLFRLWEPENKPAIVSFNYDTILESAFETHLKIQFTNINQYVRQGKETRFLFFKPHGSWNWGWEFDKAKLNGVGNDVAGWLYKSNVTPATIYYDLLGEDMLTTDGWGVEAGNHPHFIGKITPNRNKIKVAEKGKTYFPALLLPYRDKDEFVMPYNQQMQLEYTIPHIEELVLIGWKGNENLFNTKLKKRAERLKKITIANPYGDEVKKELSHYLDLSKYEVQVVKDFEEYVINHMK